MATENSGAGAQNGRKFFTDRVPSSLHVLPDCLACSAGVSPRLHPSSPCASGQPRLNTVASLLSCCLLCQTQPKPFRKGAAYSLPRKAAFPGLAPAGAQAVWGSGEVKGSEAPSRPRPRQQGFPSQLGPPGPAAVCLISSSAHWAPSSPRLRGLRGGLNELSRQAGRARWPRAGAALVCRLLLLLFLPEDQTCQRNARVQPPWGAAALPLQRQPHVEP